MKRKMKWLLPAFLVVLCLCLTALSVRAGDGGEIYFSVEKFTIGQGYLVEPSVVSVKEGETLSAFLERYIPTKGLVMELDRNSSYGWYLQGFKNADSGVSHVPACIQAISEDTPRDSDVQPEKNVYYPDLMEFSYHGQAGWCYYANNLPGETAMDKYRLKDGDVIRLRFTLYGWGGDLGGPYGLITLPDLDELTRRLALYSQNSALCESNGYKADLWRNGLAVAADMDSTPSQVEAAGTALPSPAQIAEWKQKEQGSQGDRQDIPGNKDDTQGDGPKVPSGSQTGDSQTGSPSDPSGEERISLKRVQISSVGTKIYTGKAIKPDVKLIWQGKALKKGTDYTISYANNKKAGKAKIVLKGKGSYTGSRTVYFFIKKSLGKAKVAKIAAQKYKKGKAVKPVLKVSCDGKKLKKGRDYTVSYRNNRKAGKATAVIKGKGDYTGTRKISFRIIKK
ncbi:MAG TPA: hypothetical protein DF613_06980 [Lachnospiraceae bacterium]|nr:hypothetical protein [Lachnospiraceae bacterium]